jgi:small neutral amino acid transporter SnatA (MarC family)
LITLRIRRLNLGMPRCCLIALAIVGSYLLVFMTAAGLGSLALNFLGIGERHHDGVEYAGAFLVLLIAFLSSYAPRLATPLYLRLR